MKRLSRWTDFRRRVDYGPQKVYFHETRGWEYIPIHPFAEDPQLLALHKIEPAECWKVDAWWGIDSDATLVESMIAEHANRPPGLYAKPISHEEEWSYLFAIFDAPYVTRVAFESAIARFADAGFPIALRVERGDPWLKLDG